MSSERSQEAVNLRRVADKLDARGRPGDDELAVRARLKAARIEVGDDKKLTHRDDILVGFSDEHKLDSGGQPS